MNIGMRKYLLLMGLCIPSFMYAQDPQMTTQTSNDTLVKPLISAERAKLLDNVSMIFNTRIANDNHFSDGTFENSQFNVNQFRMEIKGDITDKVYFRFRNRLTKNTNVGTEDNLSHSIDYAMVGVKLSEKWSLNLGKMSADWGGWEFDLNPIDILEYNDILEYADNFLTGVGATYRLNDNHTFTGQILNTRTDKFSEVYAGAIPEGIEESKTPFAYIANWNGKFWGGKFETLYSYSYFNEAKKRGMNYWALGNKYQDQKWTIMYDFKYSNEALDRKGIVTGILDANTPVTAQEVTYTENWLKIGHRFSPKVDLAVTLMSSKAAAKNVIAEDSGYNSLRTSYGLIPELSYYPFKNQNMRFYASYVGRWYEYSSYAKDQLNLNNYNTGRISIGFIAPLLVL